MNRNKTLDSLKFLLVCIVVYGHTSTSLYTDRPSSVFLSFLGSFTMPLFIFISGYVSKNITWEKYKISFKNLFATYVVVQFTYSIPFFLNGETTLFKFLTVPLGGLWYIVGLLIWRFLAVFIVKTKPKFLLVLSISMIIPLLFGFSEIKITAFRIVTFCPYFILGYYCTENIFYKIRAIKPIYSVIGLFVIFIFLALYKDIFYYIMTAFGEGSYSIYPTIFQGFLYRLFFYPFSIISGIFVISLATDRFCKLGKYSLGIFLIHPCIVFLAHLFISKINTKFPMLYEIPSAIIIILLSLYLSKLKPIQIWISPILLFKKK